MTKSPPERETPPERPQASRKTRGSLSTLLSVSLGALILAAVGTVSIVTLGTAGRNTFELLQDKANLTMASIEQSVRQHLDPVTLQAAYLKALIVASPSDGSGLARIAESLKAALAATPQVTGAAFLAQDGGRMVRVSRDGETVEDDWTREPELRRLMDGAAAGAAGGWQPPVWNPVLGQTIIPLTTPVMRDGRLSGLLISVVASQRLSAYVAGLSTADQTTFILYGRDVVLAHPVLARGDPTASVDRPLPPLATFQDTTLRALWRSDRREVALGANSDGNAGHLLGLPDGEWFYVYRSLPGYGEVGWTLGVEVPVRALSQEVDRLWKIALLTLALLVGALVIAVLIGRRIAAPMIAMARVARSVQALDLGNAPTLRRSRVREIDEAAQALNSMVAALRWFERYLPKRLVHQLLAKGDGGSQQAVERDVTVMFTDIRGFSRLSSQMPAADTAAFLNDHLALLVSCIERSGGTIDKYIGDSVMAFWGAPEAQADHLARACSAVHEIAAALRADNESRGERGSEPVCIRLGVATGEALVGNIGAPGRLNYTLIGDVVNVAQRLEQLGKEIDRECDVIALLAIVGTGGPAMPEGAVAVGPRVLRDRDGEIEVFRLM